MNLRNISAWSTRNPVAPLVLFAGLLFAGLLSFNRMDVVNNPEVEFPAVSVQISQPGAAPTEIESQITQRVEAAVRSISGVKNISSTASEGSSRTFVEFEIGADVNNSVNEVKNAVDPVWRGRQGNQGYIAPRPDAGAGCNGQSDQRYIAPDKHQCRWRTGRSGRHTAIRPRSRQCGRCL